MTSTGEGQVIWERTIDHEAEQRRRSRFLRWYCLPVAVLAAAVGVIAGPWSALGILIAFGLFGLLAGAWVFLHGYNLRANPRLLLDGDVVRVSSRAEIPLSNVVRWTTYPRQMGMTTATPSGTVTSGGTRVHVAGFWLELPQPDGSMRSDERELLWPMLAEDDQASLHAALDALLPGRWVPLESFRPVRS